jgi:hypothetical protein
MLRSRAFGPRTRIYHALRRGVSKHAGTLSSPFETRARTFDFVEALQHARSSGRGRMSPCHARGSSPNRCRVVPISRCQTAHVVSFPRACARVRFRFTHPSRGVGGAPRGASSCLCRALRRECRRAGQARRVRCAWTANARSPFGAPPWRLRPGPFLRWSFGGQARESPGGGAAPHVSVSGIAAGSEGPDLPRRAV